MTLYKIVFILLFKEASSCIRTANVDESGGSNTTPSGGTLTTTTISSVTTTTDASATTTTTITTTTTTGTDCCNPDAVGFSERDLPDILVTPTDGPVDANGCNTIIASCTADPGMFAFMEFNGGIGGPGSAGIPVSMLTAQLVCMDGAWTFTQDGSTIIVDFVDCFEVTGMSGKKRKK